MVFIPDFWDPNKEQKYLQQAEYSEINTDNYDIRRYN